MLSIALALMATPVTDPMQPARDGLWVCSDPDVYFKSCTILTRYIDEGNGRYSFKSQMVLDDGYDVVLHVPGMMQVRGSKVCERYQPRFIDSVRVTQDGFDAPAEETRWARAQLKKMTKPLLGAEMCSVVSREEGSDYHYVSVTLDGKAIPQMDSVFLWVDPADGWSVTN